MVELAGHVRIVDANVCGGCRYFLLMVVLTMIVGLLFWFSTVVLGLSLDTARATYWTLSTLFLLLIQITVAEPLKVLMLAAFWSNARQNIPN